MFKGFNDREFICEDFKEFKRQLKVNEKDSLIRLVDYQKFCYGVAKHLQATGKHADGHILNELEMSYVNMFIDDCIKNFRLLKDEYKDILEQDN